MKPVNYKCNECWFTTKRASQKAWMKSYCTITGRDARLYRVRKFLRSKHKRDRMAGR